MKNIVGLVVDQHKVDLVGLAPQALHDPVDAVPGQPEDGVHPPRDEPLDQGLDLWKQIVLGYPEFGVRDKAPEPNFAAWATACGGYGAKVSAAGDLPGAVKAALAFDGPALVDCDVNPDEPPMPGKSKYQQAKSFTQAFLGGQPHKMATLATVARNEFNEFTS